MGVATCFIHSLHGSVILCQSVVAVDSIILTVDDAALAEYVAAALRMDPGMHAFKRYKTSMSSFYREM